MFPSQFEYFAPKSLPEAVALLAKYSDDAKVLAGGQSLISFLKLRFANPKYLVDLGRIGGLSYIREVDSAQGPAKIVIGALTKYVDIKGSKLLREKCPILPRAASVVGDVQVRNRGTVGGAIAHADPAGDLPAAILALEGELKVLGPKGERWIRSEDFFEGMYSTALAPDEILTEIRVPALDGQKSAYLKFARRPSDFAIVGIAIVLKVGPDQRCEQIRIGVAGVSDKPYRARQAEKKLTGTRLDAKAIEEAAAVITEGMEVIENIHASHAFRTHLAGVYLTRAIQASS
jgi:carbon-monoxide dehydrogenase medium subunit